MSSERAIYFIDIFQNPSEKDLYKNSFNLPIKLKHL